MLERMPRGWTSKGARDSSCANHPLRRGATVLVTVMVVTRGAAKGTSIQLGKLTVGEPLGVGGFGVVHKATLDGIGMTFAVKLLNPSVFNSDREGADKRFLREAELLFRFRHQHIVPIYGVGEHDGRRYILMEYFEGWNLAQVRKTTGSPPPDAVLPFIEAIAAALGYAHKQDVVHRDIKPENLMTKKGDARILDFGLAALLDPNGERLTRTADAVAGDAFSAPELADNPKTLDPRCDIYSLGACWFWLLTGLTPRGRNWESAFRASVRSSVAYEHVLFRCLEQTDKRYQTADDLITDVQALRIGGTTSASPQDARTLTDDQARVLGVVVGACPADMDTVTFYKIEQEVGARQSRLRSVLALRSLVNREMLREGTQTEDFGEVVSTYRPTAVGVALADLHLDRIEVLLRPEPQTEQPAPNLEDEIPF